MKHRRVSAILFACVLSLPVFSQDAKETHSDETASQVPVLTDFHKVIYTVWHTAWPGKDIALLSRLLPEIKHFGDSIANVKLTGILRDKEKAWRESTARLQAIVTLYEQALSPVDSQKLLDAAEMLHAQYEKLVRVIRPALPQLEEFHQVLYMVYHHYLPQNNRERLVASVSQLQEKMATLEKAVLPERLKKKESVFLDARRQLARSVAALDAGLVANDPKEFTARVETMHTNYQALEKVFE